MVRKEARAVVNAGADHLFARMDGQTRMAEPMDGPSCVGLPSRPEWRRRVALPALAGEGPLGPQLCQEVRRRRRNSK